MPTPTPGQDGYDSNVQGVPVNLIGGSLQVAIGEVALGAADPGLVELAIALGGATTPKTLLDLYNVLTAQSPATGVTIASMPNVTLSSMAFTNAILTACEDTIAHTIGVQVKGVRTAAASCVAHRASLTAPDFIGATAAAPGILTGSGGGFADSGVVEGSLTATTYYGAYVIRNGMGVTKASTVAGPITPTSGHSMRFTIPTAWRITDADAIYDFFLSTDTAPKHVCSFTQAQLAASGGAGTGCVCTTAETPSAAGTAVAAWACDIGVVGANAQTTATQFASSTAYELGSIVAASTAGYNNADIFVDAQPTAFTTTAPVLTLIPVYLNDKQGANYHVGAPIYVNLLADYSQSFRQVFNLTTNGASVIILVGQITNCTVNRIDITPTSMV
jgi:hypothetical protein